MVALLAREALQMVDVAAGTHHHLKRRNDLAAGGAIANVPKESQVIPFAENQVRLRVQRAAHLAEPTIATAALQAVLVPIEI